MPIPSIHQTNLSIKKHLMKYNKKSNIRLASNIELAGNQTDLVTLDSALSQDMSQNDLQRVPVTIRSKIPTIGSKSNINNSSINLNYEALSCQIKEFQEKSDQINVENIKDQSFVNHQHILSRPNLIDFKKYYAQDEHSQSHNDSLFLNPGNSILSLNQGSLMKESSISSLNNYDEYFQNPRKEAGIPYKVRQPQPLNSNYRNNRLSLNL